MNKPKDKPPTRESVDAAKRFAASLPALPQPQESKPTTAISVNDLYLACKPLTVDYYKIDHRDMLLRIVERCHEMMAMRAAKPTDYERGFADHADFVKTWMQEQADGILDKATTLILDGKLDEYADLRQCEWAFRYVLERYNERNQAGLRKAADAL